MFLEYLTITMIGLSIMLCVGGSIFLAYNNVSGWGWFLFIALLLSTGLKVHIGN